MLLLFFLLPPCQFDLVKEKINQSSSQILSVCHSLYVLAILCHLYYSSLLCYLRSFYTGLIVTAKWFRYVKNTWVRLFQSKNSAWVRNFDVECFISLLIFFLKQNQLQWHLLGQKVVPFIIWHYEVYFIPGALFLPSVWNELGTGRI